MNPILKRTILCCALVLVTAACGKDDKKKDDNQSSVDAFAPDPSIERRLFDPVAVLPIEQVGGHEAMVPTIREDLAKIFCVHVYKLPHKSDFNAELGILCNPDQTPHPNLAMLDKFAKTVGDKPRSIQLSLAHNGEFTEAVYATVYDLPIPPKWVRSGAIQAYMMKPSQFEGITLDGSVDLDQTSATGGDLQFSKYQLSYKTNVATPDNKPFKNERKTEFNAYQVHGGNPDIGIGTEHLVEANPDYPYFNTITVTIGTQSGGSTLITIVRGSVRNNGYPDLAQKAFSDTTNAQAQNVHDGLMTELAHRIIP